MEHPPAASVVAGGAGAPAVSAKESLIGLMSAGPATKKLGEMSFGGGETPVLPPGLDVKFYEQLGLLSDPSIHYLGKTEDWLRNFIIIKIGVQRGWISKVPF